MKWSIKRFDNDYEFCIDGLENSYLIGQFINCMNEDDIEFVDDEQITNGIVSLILDKFIEYPSIVLQSECNCINVRIRVSIEIYNDIKYYIKNKKLVDHSFSVCDNIFEF